MDKRFKQFKIDQATFPGERKMSFVISTAGVDRDNDTIDSKGWKTENYMKNPVVMWAHDYAGLPVAKATSLKLTDQGLVADIEFPAPGTYPFADTVHDMLKAGFLSATSVGFRPSKFEQNSERKGFDYSEQELLEFSIVPVPSNPEALVTMRHAGIDNAVVKGWCKAINTWAAKKDATTERALSTLSKQPAFEAFAADLEVETDGGKKELQAGRFEELVALYFKTAQDQPKRLHPDDLQAIKELLQAPEKKEPEPEYFIDLDTVEIVEDDSIEIVSGETKDGGVEIDEEQFTRCMRACVQETVATVIGSEVRGAINRLRGRVD